MKFNNRSFLLVFILTTTVLIVNAVSLNMLYETAIKQQLEQLTITAKSNAHLIESDFKEHQNDEDFPKAAIKEIIEQLNNSPIHQDGFGETGEFLFFNTVGNTIHLLLETRHPSSLPDVVVSEEGLLIVPLNKLHTIPVQKALLGKSGTMIAPDYRNELVLAAYEPLPLLGYGIVAKIDLKEVQAPFIKAAWTSFIIALILIAIGSIFYIRINNAAIREVKEREYYNRLLFESSPTGLALCRMDGSLVDINTAYAAIIGRSIEETKSLSYWDITPISYEDQEALQLKELEKHGRYGPYEKEYIHSSGHLVPVSLCGHKIEIDGQNYIWSSIENITERKETEMALKRSEETFARAQAIANIGNWDWNMVTGNIDWTDEVFRIFGLQVQAFKPSYDDFLNQIHPDDVQMVTDSVNDSIANKAPYDIEHRVIRPSGEVRIVHEQGIVYCENDRPVRLIGTIHDITEFKTADRAHKIQIERNDMLLRTVQDGYWIVSPKTGSLLDSNEAYCKMSGYNKDELIGMAISELDVDHSDEVVQSVIQQLKEKGFIQFETRHRRKDGFIYNVEVSTSLANIGDETFLVAFLKDITERKQNEQQLTQYRENLEQLVNDRTKALSDAQEELVRKERLATLGQLTATVSHELRNPLSAMGPSLHILSKLCPSDNSKITKAIEILERSIWRCDHIVDELLDFTRITNIEEKDIILDDWLTELISEQDPAKEISIITDFTIGHHRCHFDPNALRRAVINVFENGCQAMTDERTGDSNNHAQLTISTKIADNRAEIIITDTGKGMSALVLSKIFEPLYSTKVYGVGLGMPTIKQIMEQHTGGIEIQSKENQGTSVTLWLPCNKH